MNILVLNGSPKVKSDTMRLTRSFLSGITAEIPCEINVVDVIQKRVLPCLGCFGCWANGDGKCVQQDDQNDILAAYVKADVILWSFPLYCYGMPSHLKAVLDRTIPLLKLRMTETDGRVQHETLVDLSKKRNLVICGAGIPGLSMLLSFVVTLGIVAINMCPAAKAPVLLLINASSPAVKQDIMPIISKHSHSYTVKTQTAEANKLSMVIELRIRKDNDLIDELSAIPDITRASLIHHDGEVSF